MNNKNNKNKENKHSLQSIFKITQDQWPLMTKLLIIAFVGIIIMNFANYFYGAKPSSVKPSQEETKNNINHEVTDYVTDDTSLEKRVEQILSKMNGVGEVSVSIIFAEGATKEYAVNVNATTREIEEKDQSGGVRTTTEKTENDQMVMVEGNQQPVLVKESMPKIQGVLIVAQGAGDPLVKEKLFKAAQTLLQVPAHRITICQKNGGW